ncbi:Golgi-resident adenosine 3',5'-bisphosphate 3'-phosphatase [Protopterus annectens]|uniref:Golgi-resident adenosine 3',5'-bisphosphate 3'-phosphatase n=1 Tax=Protopterus annectens TaxID=7888 RepID=UPI001CFB7134|nr:Golgi-resident adenosine 3',5'-bisphosphate 3'-phosphatase [Protopterus annectens]
MAPMGLRLSPLGVVVFCLLGLGVLYHLYSGFLAGKLPIFMQEDSGDSAAGSVWLSNPKSRSSSMVDLRQLLAASVEAAVLGGDEVRRVREQNTLDEKSKGKTKEGAPELYTLGDLASHRKMTGLFKHSFPNIKVISEEHDDKIDNVVWSSTIPKEISSKILDPKEVLEESITVWIDPLDATQEYTENLRQYVTTMVCVAVEGKPVIGVIHKPFSKYTAWAMVDGGSNIIARSSYSENPLKVTVSRSHEGEGRKVTQQAFGNSTVIIAAGGAGYKVLSLLDVPDDEHTKADVYLHTSFIKKWDICAGSAILRTLGGHMTTLKGEEIDYSSSPSNYDGILASVKLDHKALIEKIHI